VAAVFRGRSLLAAIGGLAMAGCSAVVSWYFAVWP
jgi:hypothetical protein